MAYIFGLLFMGIGQYFQWCFCVDVNLAAILYVIVIHLEVLVKYISKLFISM